MKKTQQIQILPQWVDQFMQKHLLFPLSGKMIVAVSGGVDSIVLLDVLSDLAKIRGIKLQAIHVNHGTRSQIEHNKDLKVIEQLCDKKNIPLLRKKINNTKKASEHSLRLERYALLKEDLKTSDLLYFAHHIDDSFEWHLMTKFKSSNPAIGIPLLNGVVRRPFMCLSKKHILEYAKIQSLIWNEDITNNDFNFERNYMRNVVIPSLKGRYPNYLRHYVSWANKSAFDRKCHRLYEDEKLKVRFWQDIYGGTLFWFPEGSLQARRYEDRIKKAIYSYSIVTRGKINKQVEKLWQAMASGKVGPISFSGGVEILCFGQLIYVYNSSVKSKWCAFDQQNCENFKDTQIPEGFFQLPRQKDWGKQVKTYISPIGLSKKKNHPLKGRGWSDILIPKTAQIARKQGWVLLSLGKLLREWS